MASLFITVWDDAAEVALGVPLQQMVVAIGATSVQSAVVAGIGNAHKRMRLLADVDCFVIPGDNPTALGDGTMGIPLGAENPEYHSIDVGQRVAVIERT
jgi:hypothetical protein